MDPDNVPMGPYLRSLENLYLGACEFKAGLPAWLTAATQLRTLSLWYSNRTIRLDAADTALLSAMPSLRSFHLPVHSGMSQQEWDDNVAQLQALVIAQAREPLLMSFKGPD